MGVSNFAIGPERVLFGLPGRDHDNLLEFVRFPRKRRFFRRCALKGRLVARQTRTVTPRGGGPGASPGPGSRNRVHNQKVVLQHPVDLVQVQPAVEVDQDIPESCEVREPDPEVFRDKPSSQRIAKLSR